MRAAQGPCQGVEDEERRSPAAHFAPPGKLGTLAPSSLDVAFRCCGWANPHAPERPGALAPSRLRRPALRPRPPFARREHTALRRLGRSWALPGRTPTRAPVPAPPSPSCTPASTPHGTGPHSAHSGTHSGVHPPHSLPSGPHSRPIRSRSGLPPSSTTDRLRRLARQPCDSDHALTPAARPGACRHRASTHAAQRGPSGGLTPTPTGERRCS
jgi:hypothetical protein